MRRVATLALSALLALAVTAKARGGENGVDLAAGYRNLVDRAYLPPDFSQAAFDEVWQAWEEPLRSQAAAASAAERRRMAFDRYGLTPEPSDSARPQQYVVDRAGNWTMNCLACHQGKVAGRVVPGAPNAQFALATLTEDLRATKARRGEKLSRMELGSLFMPLGGSNGTTNAVMFGVALMAHRDAELNVLPLRAPPPMIHHDCDAPAWWLYKRKRQIYADGFAQKGHRSLMQFILVRQNGPERFRQWERDFEQIEDWIESLPTPRYPYAIDRALADRGRGVFSRHCAACHGSHEPGAAYPGVVTPIDEISTDRARFDALTRAHRASYARSWFARFGADNTVLEPVGYQAPPLDGVWASPPYFHNGAAPTLWHVLHPAARPKVWRSVTDGYDQQCVGVVFEEFDAVPAGVVGAQRRRFFNTAEFGKSAAGHDFVDELDEQEKTGVLEYLKTL